MVVYLLVQNNFSEVKDALLLPDAVSNAIVYNLGAYKI
jgi:hypothetical protein